METKRCSACRQEKSLEEFKIRYVRADRVVYQAYCISCQREYRRAHYRANKPEYYRRVREREARIQAMAEAAKAKPCADCGNQYAPWKMDFDHVRGVKIENVSQIARGYTSIRRLLEEIAKCEVVCAHCHRDRTHFRMLAQKEKRKKKR